MSIMKVANVLAILFSQNMVLSARGKDEVWEKDCSSEVMPDWRNK